MNTTTSNLHRQPKLVAQWVRPGHQPEAPPREDPCECQDLVVENRRLKEELEQLRSEQTPIRFDPENDRMSVVDLETSHFKVHRLDLRMSSLSEVFDESLSLDKLLESSKPGEMPEFGFDKLQGAPMEIEKMKVSMPGQTLVESAEKMNGDMMDKNDLSDLRIDPQEGDILQIRGKIDKLIDIPFDIRGKLSVSEGNKIEFAVGKSKVFGIIPLPKLVVKLAARIAGKKMEEMGVEQKGTRFIMDADDFLPENVKVRLTRLGTEQGRLVLEGEKPPAPPAPERAPQTLVQF